ncbi:thiamine pyrophosphate-binding protein [Deltaproteobacteria bacterium TL4]
MDGGSLVASVLGNQGVSFIFTLSGGHIAPILVGCKNRGIRVIDVRHEVNAVFAADAVARLTGIPGVAVVTAGPGVTNTVTAVKNAQMAQSPLVLLGGASATMLRGRGSLQDIDQMSLMKPAVKWATSVKYVRDIVPALEEAFRKAQEGVPGPVFVELPIDLLYPQEIVKEWYGIKGAETGGGNVVGQAIQWYLKRHTQQLFAGLENVRLQGPLPFHIPEAMQSIVRTTADYINEAKRPVLLIGSQTTLNPLSLDELIAAIEKIGVPVFLSGMARGLLGKNHPLQFRHKRRNALKEADLVILSGVPCDFRLDYGNHINRKATLVSINRDPVVLNKNRRPMLAALGDPASFLIALSPSVTTPKEKHTQWMGKLQEREQERENEIEEQAQAPTDLLNPLKVCRAIEKHMAENSLIIADGGDFVATASYVLQPRKPLSWLDPGVFGTLGVGGGFALGAALCRPDAEIWLIYGDGSSGYSLAEFDTFVRHGLSVIAVIGNDACWSQIARDQVEVFNDDVACVLRHSDYHVVAQGFGGEGFLVDKHENLEETLKKAKWLAKKKRPVLINALIGKSDFRKGSVSV